MNISIEQSGHKGSFYYEENGDRLAEMTFTMAGDRHMIIDHTDVADALRGKGAGKQLVQAAVEHARAKQITITPLCPFARSVFNKVTEFQDVLNQ
jgi:predicted GNAT family acetyltransferase